MDPFIKTIYIEEKGPGSAYGHGGKYGVGTYYYMPYVIREITIPEPVKSQQIPPGELAVHRGTRIEAKDGYVGNVDEFVINPKNGRITHLVMREGHLCGKKDVIVPLSAMGNIRKDTMFLKLNKQQIESLPNFPLHRLWA
jgi:sporulation protein YlmC with PRC-barrel domain